MRPVRPPLEPKQPFEVKQELPDNLVEVQFTCRQCDGAVGKGKADPRTAQKMQDPRYTSPYTCKACSDSNIKKSVK